MKTLLAALMVLIPLSLQAATIHWFSDESPTGTINTNDVLVLERPSPHGYRSFDFATLQSNLVSTVFELYGTNFSITTNGNVVTVTLTNAAGDSATYNLITVTNAYIYNATNVFLTVESNVVFNGKTTINNDLTVVSNVVVYETNFNNFNYTTNLIVESNAYFFETNFVNYEYVTNLITENIFGSNAFFTNFYTETLYSTNNFLNYITNEFFVTETTYSTNNYLNYITNQYFVTETLYSTNSWLEFITNYLIYSSTTYSTNNYLNYITNDYEVTKTLYATNTYIEFLTNYVTETGFVNVSNGIYFHTNAWAGPTGTVDLAISDQNYVATGDMAITGFTSKSNYVTESVLLTIWASGADRTLYYPDGLLGGNGESSVVCTNGIPTCISLRYTPVNGGWTQAVARSFYRP